MNIRVPQNIIEKYPGMEFRGKPRFKNGRKVIKARYKERWLQYEIGPLLYHFEEDYFEILD